VQEALEAFSGRQAIQDVLFLLSREGGLGADGFQALLPPALFSRVGDVHVLGADAAAVRFTQSLHDLAQGHVLGLGEVGVRGRERDVHVRLVQPVEGRLEFGDLGALLALEGIEISPARTEETIGSNQRLNLNLFARHVEISRAGLDHEGVGLGALCKRFNNRRMSHIAVVCAVSGWDVLEGVEVGAPVVWHRAGVVEIGLVQLFNVGGVTPEQVRVRPELLHHFAHLTLGFPELLAG